MKRILLAVLAVCAFMWLLLPSSAGAQTPDASTSARFNLEENVPNDFNSQVQVVFLEILSTISCQMSGINPVHTERGCLGPTGEGGKIGFVDNGGAIGLLASGIVGSYQIPVSSTQYIAHVTSNFGVTQPAQAQAVGIGFQGLLPFLPVWEAFRNVTYLFFVIVFLFIGIGIMFQLKIDPRGAMAIQNQIPKIVIALLLITFSYAIAGFFIDLMYVAIYFIYGVISGIPGTDVSNLTPEKIQGANPFTAASALGGGGATGLANLADSGRAAIVDVVKDAIGLNGGPEVDLPLLPKVEEIGSGIIDGGVEALKSVVDASIGIIPGVGGTLADIANKIIGFGGFLVALPLRLPGLAANTIGGVIGPNTFANWVVHTISLATGIATTIGLLKADFPSIGASAFTFGAEIDFGFLGNAMVAVPVGMAVTALTEVVLRELLPNLIAFFIILIALFTAMFRLWFQLIKAYIFIFINVVFAPFWIAGSLIPGAGIGIGSWFRSLIANLAVFPATYTMLLLGKVLLDGIANDPDGVFVPPLVGEIPSAGSEFTALLGLGILLMTPEVVNLVTTALKAPKPGTGGAARSLGVGTSLAGAGFGRMKNALWYTHPKTGEAGRLKALTGRKASKGLDRTPGVGRGYRKIKQIFKSDSERQADYNNERGQTRERINLQVPTPPLATLPPGTVPTPPNDAEIDIKVQEVTTQAHARNVIPHDRYEDLTQAQKDAIRDVAIKHLQNERGYTP